MNPNFLNIFSEARDRQPTDEALKTIQEAIEKYPYFSLGHTLIAKTAEYRNGKETGNELLTAAAYSANRGLLKKYILGTPSTTVASPADESQSEPAESISTETEKPAEATETVADEVVETKETTAEVEVTPEVEASEQPPVAATESAAKTSEETEETSTEVEETEAQPLVASPPNVEKSTPPNRPRVGIDWGMNTRIRIRVRQFSNQGEKIKSQLGTFLAEHETTVAEKETAVIVEPTVQEITIEPVVEIEPETVAPPKEELVTETEATSVQAKTESKTSKEETKTEAASLSGGSVFELTLNPSENIEEGEATATPEQEIEYEIGSFSDLSFLPAKEEQPEEPETSPEVEEEMDVAAQVKDDTESEWNGIIVEEKERILEISVTPEQLQKYFNGIKTERLSDPAELKTSEPEVESVESGTPPTRSRVDNQEVQSIIDQFLENDPSVSQPTGRQKQENLAATSSVEDHEFVTETLAIIHAKQGNNSKAVKIYERLALVFPEKKSYFAEQILKLKK